MAVNVPTLPGGSATPHKAKRGPGGKHQPLHMMEGLEFCHCMCASCWLQAGWSSKGAPKGQCICRDCPCRKKFLES